ncbi:hypothetical protein [Pseudoalteromonas luteoviolacea]|uniref:hypothetical protein n=1 Tax=Pseudoalteromonas luteoviolacea TaxID=43657 RepID=UPI001B38B6AB|nr:hypothetical protein [Pseudoalteromonas luteoviolacea]MBQ4835760.1 hypothetical protein [Pseudoalteromonas luteoviolacea]
MKALTSLFLFLFSSCVLSANHSLHHLIGTWVINHDNKQVDYSFIEYQKSGDKCEISFSLVYSLEVDMYWNKWKVENGVIHSTIHNTNTLLEYGTKIGDKIKRLNEKELFVDMVIPKGEYATEYHYKNMNAKPGQVCNTVKKFFNHKSLLEQ